MDKALVYGTRDSGFDPQRSRESLVFIFESLHPPSFRLCSLDHLQLLNYRTLLPVLLHTRSVSVLVGIHAQKKKVGNHTTVATQITTMFFPFPSRDCISRAERYIQ
jgi:hypothetical protein